MIIIKNIELKYSIALTSSSSKPCFPKINEPIFAFAGRSNVGKSSVINTLLGKKVAFVSKTPGRTKQINYYLINSKFYFVDLPGYGYASVSKQETETWKYLIEGFFNQQGNIKLVLIIVDIRRGLLVQDKIMIEYLFRLNKEYFIILNKIDKLSNNEVKQQIENILTELNCNEKNILLYSAKTGLGKRELLQKLKQHISQKN